MVDIFLGYDFKEWSEVIRNLVLCFVAIYTAWLAWKGLDAWKTQKRWEADRELARLIFLDVHKIKEAIFSLRMLAQVKQTKDFIWINYDNWSEEQKAIAIGLSKNISTQLLAFDNISSGFLAKMLEASFVWGEEFSKLRRQFSGLILESDSAARSHGLILDAAALKIESSAFQIQDYHRDNILGRALDKPDLDDEFSKDFDDLITRLEEATRPKLDTPS